MSWLAGWLDSPGFERACRTSENEQVEQGFQGGFRENCRFGMSTLRSAHPWRYSGGIKAPSVIIEGFFTNMRFRILSTHAAVFYLAGLAATHCAESAGAKMRPHCQMAEIIGPDRAPVPIAASAIPTGG